MRGYYTAEKTCDLSSSPIICLSHFISPTFSACFSMITLENVMPSCGGRCGAPFSCTPGGERSSVHTGPAGFDPGIFQACTSSKTSAYQQMLCLFSFLGRRSECRKPGFELTYHFWFAFPRIISQILWSLKLLFYLIVGGITQNTKLDIKFNTMIFSNNHILIIY